jgi:hypothetical protein
MEEPLFSDPIFDALRNALYHTERRNFFDLLNRILSFVVIMLGTGVVAKIADTNACNVNYMELGVVFFATAQLVFDFGGRARTHEFLQRRYYETLSEIEEKGIRSENDKLKFSARLAVICSEEPMTMRAVDAIA